MSEFGLEKNYRKHTRMCACTEPVRTGIGAVCVEYGRPKWPITMLTHTHNHTNTQSHKHTITQTHTSLVQNNVLFFIFGTLRRLVRPVMKRLFFLGKPRKKGSLRSSAWYYFARALRGGPLWRPTASLVGCMRCQVL